MKFLGKYSSFYVIFLLCAALFFQSCGSDSNFAGPNFQYSPAPYDISQPDTSYTTDAGLQVYILQKGYGVFEVVPRDQITIRFTGRTKNGEIFDSSYNSETTSTRAISNLTPVAKTNQLGQSISPLIDGLRFGLLGMHAGEKRTIIVPPSLGYDDSNAGINGFDLRGDTLRYDVELVQILGS